MCAFKMVRTDEKTSSWLSLCISGFCLFCAFKPDFTFFINFFFFFRNNEHFSLHIFMIIFLLIATCALANQSNEKYLAQKKNARWREKLPKQQKCIVVYIYLVIFDANGKLQMKMSAIRVATKQERHTNANWCGKAIDFSIRSKELIWFLSCHVSKCWNCASEPKPKNFKPF